MTTAKTTRIAMLLDESGSMLEIKNTTLDALNTYLQALKESSEDIRYSLVSFSAMRTQVVIKDSPIKAVDIDHIRNQYNPQGGTPLIDAAVKLIRATEKVVQPADNVIIVIQTDGQENSSTEYRLADLQALIKEKSDLGWQFLFMGCDIDAYDAARQYGIAAGQTVSYGKGRIETQSVFDTMAQNTRAYAAGEAADMSWSAEQKQEAGDQYVGPTAKQPGKTWSDRVAEARKQLQDDPDAFMAKMKDHQGAPKSLVGDIEL